MSDIVGVVVAKRGLQFTDKPRMQWGHTRVRRAAKGESVKNLETARVVDHCCLGGRPGALRIKAATAPSKDDYKCLQHQLLPDGLYGGVRPLRSVE